MSAEFALRQQARRHRDPNITNPGDIAALDTSAHQVEDLLNTRVSRRTFTTKTVSVLSALAGGGAVLAGDIFLTTQSSPKSETHPLQEPSPKPIAQPTEAPQTTATGTGQITEKSLDFPLSEGQNNWDVILKKDDILNSFSQRNDPNEQIAITMQYKVGNDAVGYEDVVMDPNPEILATKKDGIDSRFGPYERDNHGTTEYVFPALGFDTAFLSFADTTGSLQMIKNKKLTIQSGQTYPETTFHDLEIFHVASAIKLPEEFSGNLGEVSRIGSDFNKFNTFIWRIFVTEQPLDYTLKVPNSKTCNILTISADQLTHPGFGTIQPGYVNLTRDATNLMLDPDSDFYTRIAEDMDQLSSMYQQDLEYSGFNSRDVYVKPSIETLLVSSDRYQIPTVTKYDLYNDTYDGAGSQARLVLREFLPLIRYAALENEFERAFQSQTPADQKRLKAYISHCLNIVYNLAESKDVADTLLQNADRVRALIS